MFRDVLILFCLACTCHGRQVQPEIERMPSGEAVARLLLALSPAASFMPATLKAYKDVRKPTSRRDALAYCLALVAGVAQPKAAGARTALQLPKKKNPNLATTTSYDEDDEEEDTELKFNPGFIPGQLARQRAFDRFERRRQRTGNGRREDPKSPKELVMLVLRIKEACAQETRLIKTGKYKTVQRLNVKLAIRFMLDNYALQDRFNAASRYAVARTLEEKLKNQRLSLAAGQACVDALKDLVENMEEFVANQLSEEQYGFILERLETASKNIDDFLQYLPKDVVEEADKEVQEENRLNAKEYPEDEEMLNQDKNLDINGKLTLIPSDLKTQISKAN